MILESKREMETCVLNYKSNGSINKKVKCKFEFGISFIVSRKIAIDC